MSQLKILSLNVRGLRKPEKRRAIFCYLKKQKASILCLQETFSKTEDETIWRAEWGGQIIFSHGSEHSRGVCILVKPNSFPLETIESDGEGRYIFAHLKSTAEELSIVNVYAPTDCRLQIPFLQKITHLLVTKTCISRVIMVGDWNTTLSHLNKSGGLPWKETIYRNGLLSLMAELNLVDIYRTLHPNTKTYTYETKSQKLKSRINYFIIAKHFINQVKKIETRSSIAPDHKAVFLSLEIDQTFKRGPGTWKFNNALLKDNEYINLIKSKYPSIQEKYKEIENRQLYWELLKMEIRSTTIAHSKKKRFNLRNHETVIQRKLEELDEEICNNQNLDDDILTEYENLKKELTGIYHTKGKEAMFRSKVRWIDNGEKPTKYFFNLGKRNYEKKVITQLKTIDGKILSRKNEEIENYYKSFPTSRIPQGEGNDFDAQFALFSSDLQNPILPQDEANELEHDLTKDELLNALKCLWSKTNFRVNW